MEREQLKTLIDKGHSIRQIGEETNKSATSIRYWMSKHELKSRIPKFNRGGLSNRHLCEVCGEIDPDNFYHKKKGRCKTCHNIEQMARVRTLKMRAVRYKGGKCESCGYDKNSAAFDFHHIDPKKKDLNWRTSRHWSWKRLKVELDKCQLLCCRCHRELHHPEYVI